MQYNCWSMLILNASDRHIVSGNETVERLRERIEQPRTQEIVVEVLTEMKRNAIHNDKLYLQTWHSIDKEPYKLVI